VGVWAWSVAEKAKSARAKVAATAFTDWAGCI
jgi:hypothetical protein